MTLKAGTLGGDGSLTPDSMAAAIERALNDLVKPAANEDLMGRRKFALAVARGVIKHLGDNASSISVKVPDADISFGTHTETATVQVDLGDWS